MVSLYPSSSYFSSSSLSPFLSSTVTEEEFKLFHNIDRVLYTRLVLNLDRESSQSLQVMALWLWLERSGHADSFIAKMLLLPDTLINSMADEAVICLNCIENAQFYNHNCSSSSSHHDNLIPLLHSVTRTGISLQFLYENRLTILRAVSKIVTQVCLIAFEDITKQVENLRRIISKQEMMKPSSYHGPMINPSVLPVLYGHRHHQLGNSSDLFMGGGEGGYSGNFMHGFDPHDADIQRQILKNEMGNVNLQVCTSDLEVPVDDRTIFLTFSKGYPISQDEVKDFFTRKYGDCIEAVHMQEVLEEDHQPLYARLIVRSPTLIRVVLEGKSKAKFSINGKHVWARKYIKKNPNRLSSSSSSLSPPLSSSPTLQLFPGAPLI